MCKPNRGAHKDCEASPKPYCTPHRSPDYCPLSESFPLLIQQRSTVVEEDTNDTVVKGAGHFFHLLENKIKAYLFSALIAKVRAPKIVECLTPADLLNEDIQKRLAGPLVIRATDSHGGFGVYVLPNGFDGIELLSGIEMGFREAYTSLSLIQAEKIIIEEYIPGEIEDKLPTEYKVHVINGEIASINVVFNRGDCGCWAEVDENFDRLDQHGCFTPSLQEKKDERDQCYAIDFATGKHKAWPMKHMDLCDVVVKPDECVLQDIKRVAKAVAVRFVCGSLQHM
jgi:hypothetical protein